ncbi:MAG: 30S ribosomal protein S12 methylthiotransferase RimO [Peptococcaceae bacterium]|nr:30S ribosomal protein S12 methylthiotransferase RimO [Peptococcaceae bacterium]
MATKVAVVSLGCAKNLVDSEVMLGTLARSGFLVVEEPSQAEVIVVNTCGFIAAAKEESINTILELAQFKAQGNCRVLIAAGCLAQKYRAELSADVPELDAIIGTGEVAHIAEVARQALGGNRVEQVGIPSYLYDHTSPRLRITPKYSAYVKVAEGCDNCCSYCVIPQMRGAFRSRSMESIVTEVKELALSGVKEIMLIAQDTTRYGQDRYSEYKLPELIRQLAPIDGIEWIRLLYCYPSHFTQELIDTMASEPKVCKYLDLPLQHADNQVLKEMYRRGNIDEIEALIGKLRVAMPDMALRTTFIVGFPGETEAQFSNLLNFVRRIRFDRVGVFTYSQEEGTPAGERLDQLDQTVKEARQDRLMSLQTEIAAQLNSTWLGKTVQVLIEAETGDPDRPYVGRTERDAPEIDGQVYVSGSGLKVGDMVQVYISETETYDLMGEAAQ